MFFVDITVVIWEQVFFLCFFFFFFFCYCFWLLLQLCLGHFLLSPGIVMKYIVSLTHISQASFLWDMGKK